MVRRLITQDLCDDCDFNDIPEVPAVTEHILAIGKGPRRRVQLCPRCERIWQPIIAVYEERGQNVDPVTFGEPARKSAAKKATPVKTAKPKELEKAPPTGKSPTQKPAPAEAKAKPRQFVVCPWPHPSKHGAPLRVAYPDRGTHADMVHDHAKLWEIPWQDPDGIMKHPCDVHTECMKTGLSFTTPRGLTQHRHACPLPRIDQENEGAPQKSDEPAADAKNAV